VEVRLGNGTFVLVVPDRVADDESYEALSDILKIRGHRDGSAWGYSSLRTVNIRMGMSHDMSVGHHYLELRRRQDRRAT
jgi:hypothetical protein